MRCEVLAVNSAVSGLWLLKAVLDSVIAAQL